MPAGTKGSDAMVGFRLHAPLLRLVAFTAALGMTVVVGGCTQAPNPPEQPSTSRNPSYLDLEKFGKAMIERGATAVLIHVRKDSQEWSQAIGVRNLESKEPVQLSDPVEIASVTKSMVAVSVLKLAEEGRINLDDPVGNHLADFNGLMHPPGPITIRNLLNHTSGMPEFTRNLFSSKPLNEVLGTRLSLTERLSWSAKTPWTNGPVPKTDYSHSNYVALGMLVEKLRGRPIGDVIKSDITEPLGLKGTSMAATGPPPTDMAHGYLLIDTRQVDVTYPAYQIGSPSGGIISTVSDLNTFYRALMRGELLKPATVAEMKESGASFDYGLGLWRWSDACTNGSAFGHPGDILGYGTASITSADGNRQVSIAITYPPAPYVEGGQNPLVAEILDVAQITLRDMC
jgi:D-alanyl-D-alanine carboxypeptidase